VYRAGGHFVAHKDTPRDPAVFGTLVVARRCRSAAARSCSITAQSAASSGRPETPSDLRGGTMYPVQWAAFYSDVDHEVEPVTDGTRVTLIWLLRRTAPGAPIPREPATTERDLEAELAAALADRQFLPSGELLGIPCAHLYTAASGRPLFAETLSHARASGLKGRDRLVALAALRAGLRARFRPYLFETSGDESWRLTRALSARERAVFRRRRVGAAELEAAIPIEHHPDWDAEDDVTWILPPPWMSPERPDPSRDAQPASELVGETEYSATDYFGNEGGDAAFYVCAALLLDVPPSCPHGHCAPFCASCRHPVARPHRPPRLERREQRADDHQHDDHVPPAATL
jgi:hypothetical protein